MSDYWNSEEIFLDGDHYFDRMIQDIDEARDYITVEMYIFNEDSLGKKIVSHLLSAHSRGVRIQIIVDGIGSYNFFKRFYTIFRDRKIPIKIYNPLPIYHPLFGDPPTLKKMQVFLSRFIRLNKRDHRKIVTIDSKIMYAGSYNFTAVHTRLHSELAWKDMGVRVTGQQVMFAILNFKKIWKLREYYRYKGQIKNLNLHQWKTSALRLNNNIFMKRYFYKDFLKRIQQAKKKIWLTTPYFIPKRKLIIAIGQAAARGVDVKLLISSKTDVFFFRTLQFFYFPFLIKKGVNIYLYKQTILHAKNFIIDDWTTIGTSNLNHRSFIHDLEVDLVIKNPENVKMIEENFLHCITDISEITTESLKSRPLWHRFLGRIFFMFKYWF